MPDFLFYVHIQTWIYTNKCIVIQILNPCPEPPPREEPIVEPIDVIVQPPVVPPPNRPGRRTNQLQYLHYFIKLVWNNTDAEPFRQPADAKNMLVS